MRGLEGRSYDLTWADKLLRHAQYQRAGLPRLGLQPASPLTMVPHGRQTRVELAAMSDTR